MASGSRTKTYNCQKSALEAKFGSDFAVLEKTVDRNKMSYLFGYSGTLALPYDTIPYIPYFTIPYYTMLYYTILYLIIAYILYHTVLYILYHTTIHTIQYHTILYYTIPYHTIPYYISYHINFSAPSSPYHPKNSKIMFFKNQVSSHYHTYKLVRIHVFKCVRVMRPYFYFTAILLNRAGYETFIMRDCVLFLRAIYEG